MGCSTSQSSTVAATKENGLNEKAEADRKYPPGEAFEVSLDEEAESIIKKHPPKRLQRLVDAPSTQTTIEELEEKLANAEIRRNQFLMERANPLKSKDDETNDDDETNVDEETRNEQKNNESNNETPTADRDNSLDVPVTDVQNANSNLSISETQENDLRSNSTLE